MKAIILAAGVARRLYPITYGTHKCLIKVGRQAIIDYQLKALRNVGIKQVILVLGYYGKKVFNYVTKNYPDFQFSSVMNEHFFDTNTAYSLHLCRDYLRQGEHLLMNGDVLYPSELLKRLVSCEGTVLAVEVKTCGREEVKVIGGSDSRIVAIGKELIEQSSLGEFIGVTKFSQGFSNKLAGSLEKLIKSGGKSDYFEAAIQPLLARSKVYYIDVSDLPCIEIDFIEDVEKAKRMVSSPWFKV